MYNNKIYENNLKIAKSRKIAKGNFYTERIVICLLLKLALLKCIADNKSMPVLHDEVPDNDDFDAKRPRGEFDNIAPEDFAPANPPGWLSGEEITSIRSKMPITYVQIVPVRVDEMGRVTQIGTLLSAMAEESIQRTIIAGRVLYHETIREAIARNIAKDLGDIALPTLPINLQPFTVAEFFPTPGVSDYYDERQHAIALCYVVPIEGDCRPHDETLAVQWLDVDCQQLKEVLTQMPSGLEKIVGQAIAWVQ